MQERQRHLDDVSRLTEAVHRQVPQLRYARAPSGGRSCAVTGKEMKTLRAHGFNQRPRFEQVVGYIERAEPRPWTNRTARPPCSSRATSTWTTSCSPVRTPTLGLCSTRPCTQFPRTASALPHKDVRLARMYRGGGNRIVEATWQETPSGALASNGCLDFKRSCWSLSVFQKISCDMRSWASRRGDFSNPSSRWSPLTM